MDPVFKGLVTCQIPFYCLPMNVVVMRFPNVCLRICCKYIQAALDRIEKQGQGEDADPTVLEMLLSNEKLTQQEVLTMITDMLIAGIDTVRSMFRVLSIVYIVPF